MGVSLADVVGGNLIDAVKGIISQFHMSPEDKAKLNAQIDQEHDAFVQAENDYNVKLNSIAGENIRAEAADGAYSRNARPSVIWIGLGAIVWNYCLVPVFGFHWHMTPTELPTYFWEAWGVICTGYVFNRTAEKIMGMPGDSSIKLPFGIQVGQKSSNQ